MTRSPSSSLNVNRNLLMNSPSSGLHIVARRRCPMELVAIDAVQRNVRRHRFGNFACRFHALILLSPCLLRGKALRIILLPFGPGLRLVALVERQPLFWFRCRGPQGPRWRVDGSSVAKGVLPARTPCEKGWKW